MNCDGIARYYEAVERLSLGNCLEHRRFAFLGEVTTSQRAILCGGGDGRFLARLLRENSTVQVDFVDLSPKMTELAERRIMSMGRTFRRRVVFHPADIREFAPQSPQYDLIVTHFFLDCFTGAELESVIHRLASWAIPSAKWMVSDFHEADGLLGSWSSRAFIRGLYGAFRLTTGLRVTHLPDYQAALRRRGWVPQSEEEGLGGLLHSSLWTVEDFPKPRIGLNPGPLPVDADRVALADSKTGKSSPPPSNAVTNSGRVMRNSEQFL